MGYLGNRPAEAYSAFQKQDFSTSATTSYTLDHPVANQNEIALFINFVRQEPTTAYTASGTSLTLTSATSSSDDMYCIYLGKAVQTVNPPSGSVGSSQVASTIITGQTAETSIATDDTVLIHDTSAGALRKMTRANFVSGVGGDNTPAFYAYMSANQTGISDVTRTIVQFNTELFDTDSAYDTSTYKFTVPSGEGGKYIIGFRIAPYFYSDKGYQFQMNLLINGSTLIELGKIREPSNDNSRYGGTSTETMIFNLSAGDYIQAEIYANTRSNNSYQISGTGAQSANYFYGYKLIGV